MDILQKVDATLSGIYHDYLKLVKYLAVGAIGTIADWSVFYLLIDTIGVFYLVAMAVSYLVGMIINFFLNKHYTFENTYKKLHFQFASFAVIALIGLALQEAIMYGLVQFTFSGTSDSMLLFVARVVATIVGFIWTFIANKKITFKIFQ